MCSTEIYAIGAEYLFRSKKDGNVPQVGYLTILW
jgi:hypothetical protein